ncbi:hypothetical protein SMI01S_23310 [Sphingobacterium mizutaii NBRC 14946 = DSM 11724]|uniref:Uncharacterized protein n=2 Tax=Sphingobacterium mizutaii TaxID=1010 RepID=A0AAJ4X9Y1_9SPHI|nr:hypothetical protein SMI01S_23310 [Sphingobacterium mizutaii NBRC 14946 = DSM 11724]SDK87304.1 hypothetical protein SAMN05192578_10159 [Sphingobacterium mizutaii]SNV46011.1 Uncharacterised protein [Sphingobacterium mizutaii]
MSTDIFYTYFRATTKDYSSGYISMSRNYLRNFGVFQFTKEEIEEFLSLKNPEDFIRQKYGVKIPDLLFLGINAKSSNH